MDAGLQAIIEAALRQGIWAALYIYLFFRMLKESAVGEERCQEMIGRLSSDITAGIADIQDRLKALGTVLNKQTQTFHINNQQKKEREIG